MAAVHPYVHFNGNAEEAFNFYKDAFGAEFSNIQRYSDVPAEAQVNSDDSDRILHVSLPVGGGTILMGSDIPSSFPPVKGDNYFVSIQAESEAEAKQLYERLSEGGTVLMPLEKTFFASWFGMIVDRFGVRWMVSCDPE